MIIIDIETAGFIKINYWGNKKRVDWQGLVMQAVKLKNRTAWIGKKLGFEYVQQTIKLRCDGLW